ncbi:hypothetical protein C5O25_03655 [Paramuribaculum intestinale]|uniref:Uncharacterized protein n=2 Tax=Paramuribaculum intestinale TaxID=2094151 RepID=A0A2V1IZP3_9BACT|nr:ribonuclease P protein component [Paramuribaculum intestinale]PWB05909.1 hypothetical protein C5O24_10775 [Paramuribaculum intestinale]PWB08631.1 hypothetical protein C5O25_03655 [Paramuribaculum intestinale]WLT41690.1 ribonuclease P protein component [Paramuribaculum intestinale]
MKLPKKPKPDGIHNNPMTSLRLYKKEKLCSQKAIEKLFSPAGNADGGNSFIMAYPWRAVWRESHRHENDRWKGARFLIAVPKKRLRHAVDRVTMRRRCREAYRLCRQTLLTDATNVDIAFIYVGQGLTDFNRTQRAVEKILTRIYRSVLTPDEGDESCK